MKLGEWVFSFHSRRHYEGQTHQLNVIRGSVSNSDGAGAFMSVQVSELDFFEVLSAFK